MGVSQQKICFNFPESIDFPGVLKKIRSAWANCVLSGELPLSSDLEVILQSPYQKHPIIEVLSFLLLKKLGKKTAPLACRRKEILSLYELCQLALLSSIAGIDGQALGKKLLHLCSFPSLWCPESTYNEKEAKISTALLLRAFGKEVVLPENSDPYFIALNQLLPSWEAFEAFPAEDPLLALSGTGFMQPFTGSASHAISLGALHSGAVEILAFGPQLYPLNDSKFFGVLPIDQTWSAVFAKRDIWCKTTANANRIESRFFGIGPHEKFFFVFYVRAERAKIQEEVYVPRSLRRYCGTAQRVLFQNKDSSLFIENLYPGNMEIIPLAGEGCFWNSGFLLAFEISPHDSRVYVVYS